MSEIRKWHADEKKEQKSAAWKGIRQAVEDLYKKALTDAKTPLHPLLKSVDIFHLERRHEFVQAFKLALEQRIAERIAAWQPGVQAVFKFDESWVDSIYSWDGSIHLLVKIPRLSNSVNELGKKLDQSLTQYLKRMGWSCFQTRQSILDIQQVTPNELRHRIGYGAMFQAVHSAPLKVWSP